MRILVKLGDLYGATRLIPIESAHISGVSYKTIGDAPTEFLEEIVKTQGKTKVRSTVNPSAFDVDRVEEMGISKELRQKQFKIIDLYKKMGVTPALTCTPYYLEKPKPGSHLAWAESSAVVYANSVWRAWTNREGGPSALASALIGKTPNYGMHRPDERNPNILVKIKPGLKREIDFGALGIYVGKLLKEGIPIFSGLTGYTKTGLKQLGAGLASSGMTSIFYIREETERKDLEKITIGEKDLRNTIENLSTGSEPPDLVFLGCPHSSLSEIKWIAEEIKHKKVRNDVRLWICTSRHVRNSAKRYVDIIEAAGGKVLCDTCAVVAWLKNLGVETLMTNSAKTAYYAPTFNRVETVFAPMKKCIDAACEL